jgi:signal peptidase I
MEPNFKDGDYLLVDEISYRFRSPQRGDVIVFRYPKDLSQRFIKRIIGLPGETVEVKNGKITIYNEKGSVVLNENNYLSATATSGDLKFSLGEYEYFVLGDNRDFSYDSRRFGVLPKEDITGRVFLRAWPFNALSEIKAPAY